ncbi:MAG: hypothetical protein KGJ33_01015, partial [Patescibacteria group bacterium]|nr:hypothetical protein [Patescibacteria group bacterium]
ALDSDKAGKTAAMRAVAATALSMGMSVKIADIEGGKDPADLIRNNPEDWKTVLRDAKHVIEFELGNVLEETADPHKLARAIRERIFPFLARIDSEMDKAFYVKMIAEKAGLTEVAVWDDLRKTKVERPNGEKAEKSASHIASTIQPFNRSAFSPESAGVPVHRIDLVERRMFGLLALMDAAKLPAVAEYRETIRKIAGRTYEERLKKIEPIQGELAFEAEAFFGNDERRWVVHMKELVFNFEEDIINQELIRQMGQLKLAERAGDSVRVAELARICQALSVRKAELTRARA